jgi:SNF2 family DNA or RNA helicase
MREEKTKFNVGKFKVPVTLYWSGDTIELVFGYNKALIEQVKLFQGAKWNPNRKRWSIKANNRNIFQLERLEGLKPYEPYDCALLPYESKRTLYPHQIESVQHCITRKGCILAEEMGTGKTLSAIETMEYVNMINPSEKWIWVGPKSALIAVQIEFRKWKAKVMPTFTTYESLHKYIDNNYVGVIFDECSKVKNPSAKRTRIAFDLAEKIRDNNGYVILMSGTPAPRNPSDWWALCEIACPGFLVEGNIHKFKNTLGLIQMVEGLTANVFPRLKTWFDRDGLCRHCGEVKSDPAHQDISNPNYHIFENAGNQVERLGRRLNGLVLVKHKKDVMSWLPDKVYQVITCKPDAATLRAASFIKNTATHTGTALIRLRELSDGFQYMEEKTDQDVCCLSCDGVGTIMEADAPDGELRPIQCPKCNGTGLVKKMITVSKECKSPKEQILKDLLDEYEEYGRVAIYAPFKGSINKVIKIVQSMGWEYVKVDGSGWTNSLDIKDNADMILEFQEGKTPLMAFIGQPGAGGMGLTLTKSPVLIFYSNDFDYQNRAQTEDRIHRPGMDINVGAKIIDIVNLSTDQFILDNLKAKKTLQAMPLDTLKNYRLSNQGA